MPNSYTTQTKIQGFLGEDVPAAQVSSLAAWIQAASDWIDNYCDKQFTQGAASDRYYDAIGQQKELLVDEFTGTPTVVLLDLNGQTESTLASTDFNAAPYNETVKNRIVLSDGGAFYSFGVGKRRVKVTATFWRASVPPVVELVCTMIVAKIIRRGSEGGDIASESLGEYSISFQKIDEEADILGVKTMLDPYKDVSL